MMRTAKPEITVTKINLKTVETPSVRPADHWVAGPSYLALNLPDS